MIQAIDPIVDGLAEALPDDLSIRLTLSPCKVRFDSRLRTPVGRARRIPCFGVLQIAVSASGRGCTNQILKMRGAAPEEAESSATGLRPASARYALS